MEGERRNTERLAGQAALLPGEPVRIWALAGWAYPVWEKERGRFLDVHANKRQCGLTTKIALHLL